MNAKQEAKFTMFRAVEQHCDDNPAAVAAVTAFQTAVTDFKSVTAQIGDKTQLSDAPIAGVAEAKSNQKKVLIDLSADMAGLVSAFASVAGDDTLREQVNFTKSKLLQTRDDELGPRCQNIHDRAAENMPAVKDYGVSDAKLAALQDAIDAFEAASPKPRVAISVRKTYRADLKALLKQGDDILDERMDKIVSALRADFPDFVKTYASVRVIVDPASTSTQIKGRVTDAATHHSVVDADVTITSTNQVGPTTTLSAATGIKGKYIIRSVPSGIYSVTITAEGFADHVTAHIEIKRGEITHHDVELEAV